MIKILTGLFFFFITGIIAWADSGQAFGAIQLLMQVPHGDKLAHFILLGVMSFLVNLSLDCRSLPILGRNFLLGSLLTAIVISIEECSQAFIPHRNFEILDFVSNYAGIFVFGQLAHYYYGKKTHQTLPV